VNFLIVKPSSLGDIIHTFPAVDLIRRAHPEGTITWVVNDNFAGIVELCPAVDEVVIFRRRRLGKLRHVPELFSFLGELRQHPHDVAIDFQGLFRSGVMTLASGASRRVGFQSAREGATLFYNEKVMLPANLKHAVDKNVFLAKTVLGMPNEDARMQLPPHHDLAKCARKLLKRHPVPGSGPIVAVAPAARWDSKTWPLRFFADVLDEVAALRPDVRCWALGSADEAERCARLDDLCRNCRVLNLAGETNLGMLTELLRASDVLVTNDSGPMHLAAAVGTPTVAFFGATDPELTGPYGPRHAVFRTTCDLSPCFSRQCLMENRACSDGTSPMQVAQAVFDRLDSRSGSPDANTDLTHLIEETN
jgi:lipopolysaccharide heptosyltransferase I